ncbi:MAG: phage tail protein [Bradyrhizobium sp.]|uniref:phage tail protein n=1 Tax=Bradyrhizobium sp. TaxID=376 RepID=UPI00346F80F8
MTLYKWSQTASTDATADSTINWAEGQSPSSVNDSARAMMAAIAKYRDDTAGAIVTTGTNSAYAVNSYQVFQSFSHLNGQIIAFTPHVTNGATVTLNVDGLGARPLRSAPLLDLPAGTIVQGTPYTALYNAGDAAFYLVGFFSNPYNVPIGSCIDFFGTTAPNSSFVLAYGQAISRATYSMLFSLFGTTYGPGDGSTTFNIPDLRGRIVAGRDDMGGGAASRLTAVGITTGGANTLGGYGGGETKTLITENLPAYTPSGTISGSLVSPITVPMRSPAGTGSSVIGAVSVGISGGTDIGNQNLSIVSSSISASFTGSAQGGTSTPIVLLQPTIISNKLIRII